MRKIAAFKAQLPFCEDTDRYYVFLKQQLLKSEPTLYVVSQRKRINTQDGIMYTLRIVQDIEIPDLEPIAECWINSVLIYLWRDHCWTIAVNRHGQPIIKNDKGPHALMISTPQNKTIIIHKIGTSQV